MATTAAVRSTEPLVSGSPRQEAERLAANFPQVAVDAWTATPEYQRSPYRVMHERKATGLPPLYKR